MKSLMGAPPNHIIVVCFTITIIIMSCNLEIYSIYNRILTTVAVAMVTVTMVMHLVLEAHGILQWCSFPLKWRIDWVFDVIYIVYAYTKDACCVKHHCHMHMHAYNIIVESFNKHACRSSFSSIHAESMLIWHIHYAWTFMIVSCVYMIVLHKHAAEFTSAFKI